MSYKGKAQTPKVIFYWKNKQWKVSPKVFHSDEEINSWYRRNRSRIDGLSVVKPLSEKTETLKRLKQS